MSFNAAVFIKTCWPRTSYLQACLDTWIKECPWPVIAVYGDWGPSNPTVPAASEECAGFSSIQIEGLNDTYQYLPVKTSCCLEIAMDSGYDHIVMLDDDTYFNPEFIPDELLASDYWGKENKNAGGYCSGFCYGLSHKSMEIILKAQMKPGHEDALVGQVLREAGIAATYSKQVILVPKVGGFSRINWPSIRPDFIGVAELNPKAMLTFQHEIRAGNLKGVGPRQLPGMVGRSYGN